MYKMIVSDLDGTLLNKDSKISDYTKERLKYYKSKNINIVACSGRNLESIKYVSNDLNLFNYVIFNNGAGCYDVDNDTYVFKYKIPSTFIEFVFNSFNDTNHHIDFRDEFDIYRLENYGFNYPKNFKKVYYLEDIIDKNMMHISITYNSNEIVLKMKDELINMNYPVEVTLMQDSFSNHIWIDVVSKSVNKYTAIYELMNKLNIKNEEIIAFGDGLNDICMLECIKHGVAINNALETVKKSANYITEYSNDEDGVVKYLDNLL